MPRTNCSPARSRSSTDSTSKKLYTERHSRSLEPARRRARHGLQRAARNWTKANCAPLRCSATVRRLMPGRSQMPDLPLPQSQSNALSKTPGARTLYFIRCRRSRMQSRYRRPPKTRRNALDTQGRQTPSSPSVAAISVVALRTSGKGGRALSPPDPSLFRRTPLAEFCKSVIHWFTGQSMPISLPPILGPNLVGMSSVWPFLP